MGMVVPPPAPLMATHLRFQSFLQWNPLFVKKPEYSGDVTQTEDLSASSIPSSTPNPSLPYTVECIHSKGRI